MFYAVVWQRHQHDVSFSVTLRCGSHCVAGHHSLCGLATCPPAFLLPTPLPSSRPALLPCFFTTTFRTTEWVALLADSAARRPTHPTHVWSVHSMPPDLPGLRVCCPVQPPGALAAPVCSSWPQPQAHCRCGTSWTAATSHHSPSAQPAAPSPASPSAAARPSTSRMAVWEQMLLQQRRRREGQQEVVVVLCPVAAAAAGRWEVMLLLVLQVTAAITRRTISSRGLACRYVHV